jgi:hypothetical protein
VLKRLSILFVVFTMAVLGAETGRYEAKDFSAVFPAGDGPVSSEGSRSNAAWYDYRLTNNPEWYTVAVSHIEQIDGPVADNSAAKMDQLIQLPLKNMFDAPAGKHAEPVIEWSDATIDGRIARQAVASGYNKDDVTLFVCMRVAVFQKSVWLLTVQDQISDKQHGFHPGLNLAQANAFFDSVRIK